MFALLLATCGSLPFCASNNGTLEFTRCLIPHTPITWRGKKQLALFAHSSSPGEVIVENGVANVSNIKKSEAAAFISNSVVTTHCTSPSGCPVSVWFTDYAKDNAYYTGDAAGAVLSAQGDYIDTRYPIFFDFGSISRVKVDTLQHPRHRALTLYMINQTTHELTETYLQEGDSIDTDGPFIFHFSSSPLTPVYFRIVVGTPVRVPTVFDGAKHPTKGAFTTYYKDGTIDHRINQTEKFVILASEAQIWTYLSMVMPGIAGVIFIVSVVVIVIQIVSPKVLSH